MSPEQRLAAGRRMGARRVVRAPSSRRGNMGVSEVQRARMLSSAIAVVSQHGYAQMSVARVSAGAGVSRRTFYELFEDREDCFLAAFDDILERVAESLVGAYAHGRTWPEKTRNALGTLLAFLDEDPGARRMLIVDVLGAGPRVLERRARILRQVAEALHHEATQMGNQRELPPLTAEGVVGAVLGVIHTRVLQVERESLLGLLNPLMGTIVLPYRGTAAAQRELAKPVPKATRVARAVATERDPLVGLDMRLTQRRLMVLAAIGEQPGASNRRIATAAGISDQGQISKLLARLESLKLIVNTGHGQSNGEPNAWQLTPRGQEIQRAIQVSPASPIHA